MIDHLEFCFENTLGKGQIFTGFNMLDAPRVVHVHGEVPFPSMLTPHLSGEKFWPAVSGCTSSFVMVDEPRLDHSTNASIAKRMLKEASRIFILGFDFHDQNVDLIGLNDANLAEKSFALNWNGTHRVRQRAEDIGIPSHQILAGTKSSPLEIASAIVDDGLFSMRPF